MSNKKMMIRMQVAKDLYRSVFVMIELLKMVAMCRARSVSQVIDSIDRAQCPDFGKLVGGPDELVYHLDRVLRAFRPIGSVLNFFLWPRFRFRSQLCNYRSLLIYKAIRCTNTPAEVNIFLRFSGEAANGHCWITIEGKPAYDTSTDFFSEMEFLGRKKNIVFWVK